MMKNMKITKPNSPEKRSISDMPSPIISDILSKLPTKSVLSSKLVCKLWRSLITNPNFTLSNKSVSLIVRCAGDNPENNHRHLHLVEPEIDCAVSEVDGNSCLMVGPEAVIEFNDDEFNGIPVDSLVVVNSCQGLVCLSFNLRVIMTQERKDMLSWDPLIVCNPVPSDYVVVEQPLSAEMWGFCILEYVGFGFCSRTGEYKVFRLFKDLKERNVDECREKAGVFTLRSDTKWRQLENSPQGNWTVLEGALHWTVFARNQGSLVAFDCQEEIFVLTDFPIVVGNACLGLGVLCSQLAFSFLNGRNNDIWVMNEYGVKESWKKLFVISAGGISSFDLPFRPLAYWNNGEIVMLSFDRKLVSYNVTLNTWRPIVIAGLAESVEAVPLDPVFLSTKALLTQRNAIE